VEEAESPVGINAEAINRTAVVRDPYARWCGRRGAARPLPIPIRQNEDKEGNKRIIMLDFYTSKAYI